MAMTQEYLREVIYQRYNLSAGITVCTVFWHFGQCHWSYLVVKRPEINRRRQLLLLLPTAKGWRMSANF